MVRDHSPNHTRHFLHVCLFAILERGQAGPTPQWVRVAIQTRLDDYWVALRIVCGALAGGREIPESANSFASCDSVDYSSIPDFASDTPYNGVATLIRSGGLLGRAWRIADMVL